MWEQQLVRVGHEMCKLCHSSLIPFDHRGGLALRSTQSEGKGRQSVVHGLPQRVHATLNDTYFLSLLKTTDLTHGSSIFSTYPLLSLRRKARKHYIPECSEQTVLKEPPLPGGAGKQKVPVKAPHLLLPG